MRLLIFLFLFMGFQPLLFSQSDHPENDEKPDTEQDVSSIPVPAEFQFYQQCEVADGDHEGHDHGDEESLKSGQCNELFSEDELAVMPIKRIRTRVHIMQKHHASGNGQGARNFPNTPAGRAMVEDIINEINFEIFPKMRVHATSNFQSQPYRDSKIRLEVTAIEYHEDPDWDLNDCDRGINTNCVGQLNAWYNTHSGSPNTDDDEMHLFFGEDYNPTLNSGRGRAYGFNAPRWDLMANTYYSYVSGGITSYQVGTDQMQPFQVFNSPLSNHRAKAVAYDNHGSVWMGFHAFGTANDFALIRYDGTNFSTFLPDGASPTANAILPGKVVSSIAVEAVNPSFDFIWVGTEDGGIVRFDGVTWQPFTTSTSNLPSNKVLDIKIEHRSSGNVIWIATDVGLVSYDNNNGFQLRNTSNSGIPGNYVKTIGIEERPGNSAAIWVATNNASGSPQGVARMAGSSWTNYTRASTGAGLVSDAVGAINAEPDGNGGSIVWVGTIASAGNDGGLSRFSNGSWTTFDLADGFPIDRSSNCAGIKDIEIDGLGNKWMATTRGLVRFDGNAFFWRHFGNTYNDNYTPSTSVPAPDEIGLAGNFMLDASVEPGTNNIWTASMNWGGGWHQSVGGGNRAAAYLTVHELGHNFGLLHSWSDGTAMQTPGGQGTTNNIMDYSSANPKGLSQPQLNVWHDRAMLNTGTVGLTVIEDWCDYDPQQSIEIGPGQTIVVDDGPKFMHGDLIIKNNAHLIVKCEISFPEGASLHVEQGGTLTIDGGTLTNSCTDQLWEGVQVYGTRISPQRPVSNLFDPDHGTVFIHNGGTIEHSRFGITTQHIGEPLTEGGRVFAQDALFLNNRFSVEFRPFEFDNVSYFRNCRFECSAPMKDPNYQTAGRPLGTATHFRMWGVNGIELSRNLFINTGTFDPDLRGLGIASYDADYTVRGNCLSYNTSGCTNLADAFVNLSRGIQFETSDDQSRLEVKECRFTNNNQGVFLQGGSEHRLADNVFTGLAYKSSPTGVIEGWGAYLETSGDTDVTGNTFAPPQITTLQPARAIVLSNSGQNAANIRNNQFQEGFMIGIHALLDNSVVTVACNDFASEVGLMVFDGNSSNPTPIFPTQGVNGVLTAGNRFLSGCNGGNGYSDIYYAGFNNATGNNQFQYVCNSLPNHIPTCYSANVNVSIQLGLPDPCNTGGGDGSNRTATNRPSTSMSHSVVLDESVFGNVAVTEALFQPYVPQLPEFDGQTTPSAAEAESLLQWQLGPNPIRSGEELQIALNFTQAGTANLVLRDLNGRNIWSTSRSFTSSIKQWRFTVPNTSAGVYLLELVGPTGERSVKRLVIQP